VVSVDLESQTITGPDGGSITFDVDPFRKHCLLNGLDDIGLTMEKAASIDTFETQAVAGAPLGLTHCPDWGTLLMQMQHTAAAILCRCG
jgi:hypothetical protein